MVAFLPVVILVLVHWSDVGYLDFGVFTSPPTVDTTTLGYCTMVLLAWFGFQVVLERILPGPWLPGAPIHGDPKNRLKYRINGHLAFWVTCLVVAVGWPTYDPQHQVWQLGAAPLRLLYQYYTPLAMAAMGLGFLLSVHLYLQSLLPGAILANDTNSVAYDFFMGRELNPRWGSFDWKVFCELRPGLMGWMLLNAACAAEQYAVQGYVSYSMLLINALQGMYVWDALFQEEAILTTMDITTDGFGYMLVLGDLAWVPFTYSVQARYLVHHDPHLSVPVLAAIMAWYAIGYWIFRSANGQKDHFRKHPEQYTKFLPTKRGTKLLTGGWWGLARKINYTGDWIMGLTWCMLCGFNSIVPYFYAVYFFLLLWHRSIRDDHMCQGKYGADWDKYKEIVPYRFIPGLI